jgi:hypothetical protein
VQWIVFRGVGHGQVDDPNGWSVLTAACGKTTWPGLLKFQSKPPPRICEKCAVALGMDAKGKRQTPSAELTPPKPHQGSLF